MAWIWLWFGNFIGGIYFGEKGTKQTPMGLAGYDVEIYAEEEVRRIGRVAFEMAMKRNKKVTSVDKANVLESSRLWRRVVEEVALEYPEVTLSHLYVDNAAMQLVIRPKQFDVIVTGNMFGDSSVSDEASMITGSIGMRYPLPVWQTKAFAFTNRSTDRRRTLQG